MERDLGSYIINRVNDSLSDLNALLVDVKNDLSEAEYSKLKRAVARIMNNADSEIIEGIVEQHPDLSPWEE